MIQLWGDFQVRTGFSRSCSGAFATGLVLLCVETSLAQCPESRTFEQYGSASFDFPAGVVEAGISARLGATAVVNAIDDFEITGVAPSTVVHCKIQMTLLGTISRSADPYQHWLGGHARVHLRYSQADRTEETEVTFANHSNYEVLGVATIVELPIVITVGTPFRAEFDLYLNTDIPAEESSIQGKFRFVDLPPVAGVRSCSGYRQAPVPIQGQTWTGIKDLYRR